MWMCMLWTRGSDFIHPVWKAPGPGSLSCLPCKWERAWERGWFTSRRTARKWVMVWVIRTHLTNIDRARRNAECDGASALILNRDKITDQFVSWIKRTVDLMNLRKNTLLEQFFGENTELKADCSVKQLQDGFLSVSVSRLLESPSFVALYSAFCSPSSPQLQLFIVSLRLRTA